MKKKRLIRSTVIHDVRATDEISGRWHDGWRKPDSETTAFYYKGRWYASRSDREAPFACNSKEEALNS